MQQYKIIYVILWAIACLVGLFLGKNMLTLSVFTLLAGFQAGIFIADLLENKGKI